MQLLTEALLNHLFNGSVHAGDLCRSLAVGHVTRDRRSETEQTNVI